LTYYQLPLTDRRYSTERPSPETAADLPKSVELESRISRLELLTKGLQEEMAIRQRREAAMQAELDHLWARIKIAGGV
jgi:hypothetical protein